MVGQRQRRAELVGGVATRQVGANGLGALGTDESAANSAKKGTDWRCSRPEYDRERSQKPKSQLGSSDRATCLTHNAQPFCHRLCASAVRDVLSDVDRVVGTSNESRTRCDAPSDRRRRRYANRSARGPLLNACEDCRRPVGQNFSRTSTWSRHRRLENGCVDLRASRMRRE